MNFINEIIERWNSTSPKIFVTIQKFGVWCIATAAALLLIPVGLHEAGLTTVNFDFLAQIAKYLGIIGGVIKVIAKLPVQNPSALK